ncbi:hypothetical protein PENTCL1PPCAC_24286, partial [Pristionchus entomophagus]
QAGMHSLLACGGPIYIALFLYRHQALLLPGSRFKFSQRAQFAFVIILLIPCSTFGIALYQKHSFKNINFNMFQHMSDDWDPTILERVDCFAFNKMIPYWAYCAIIPSFVVIFLTAVSRHTFSMLRHIKHISVRTREKHRILTRSLVVQALLPCVVVILPYVALMVSTMILFYISPNIYDDIPINLADITILCISFHATLHCSALIFTTPVFRKTLAEVGF